MRQVRVSFEEEHIVKDVIRARDRGIDVAELQRDSFVHVPVIAVVVNARLGVCQAVGRRRKRTQWFVLHVDQLHRLLRRQLIARDHRRNRVADKADFVAAERVLVVTDGQDAVRDGEVGAGENQMHAVNGGGFRSVDARNERVRNARSQQPAMQHARKHEVVGELRLSGDLRTAVNTTPCAADDVTLHREASSREARRPRLRPPR